ncbi:MAG: cation transporting ATPase C-terminal domain-containing protein, partial [Saprospiraceae bacterium]|nr:cation transporting ATPase C-terminal domain-containing protein [Saprospiraceae bacterium]
EGRRIYDNIRKFIVYVLSCNLAEILTILIAPLLGFAIPLLPIHILWINLVTDGLPGMALVAEPAEADSMRRPPRSTRENLFAGGMIRKILMSGTLMTLASIFIQYWSVGMGYDVQAQQTIVFTTLCFVQLGNALSVRSDHDFIFSKRMFSNKMMWVVIAGTVLLQLTIVYISPLPIIFKTASLNVQAMEMIVLVTVGCIICIETLKRLFRKKYGDPVHI